MGLYDDYVQSILDSAPTLDEEKRARLTLWFSGGDAK